MKEKILIDHFKDGVSFAGMTHKNAGNFYPNSFGEGVQFAEKVLDMAGRPFLTDVAIMYTRHEGGAILFREMKNWSSVHCDGLIFHGMGAAMFFSGGCVAVAFHDRKADISGLLHGSWQSIGNKVIKKFLHRWKGAGGSPTTTQIKFLPSICGKCLTFDVKYFEKKVSKALPDADMFKYIINKRYVGFDLVKLVERNLNHEGYNAKNKAACVCCSGKYWCYRNDDRGRKKYRNAAFIIAE